MINTTVKPEVEKKIEQQIWNILSKYLSHSLIRVLEEKEIISQVTCQSKEDLLALAEKDPASKNCPYYILNSYLCFKAVLNHRIAHALHNFFKGLDYQRLQIISRKISEQAKIETSIEIHPAAEIGRRFIIDHGFGTVVGEETVIGDDCYLLNEVTLGAKRISDYKQGRRHPKLGNRVHVGAHTDILGAVSIGDDVKISPRNCITTDIPANSRVIAYPISQIIQTDNNGLKSLI